MGVPVIVDNYSNLVETSGPGRLVDAIGNAWRLMLEQLIDQLSASLAGGKPSEYAAVSTLSANTRKGYLSDLADFRTFLDNNDLDPSAAAVEEYRAGLQESGLAFSTINRRLSSIRWVASKMKGRWLRLTAETDDVRAIRTEVLMTAEAMLAVEGIAGSKLQQSRAVRPAELAAMLSACDTSSPSALRNGTLVSTLYATGLRLSEAVALLVSDYQDGWLRVRAGKGNKERKVPIRGNAAANLDRWLAMRGDNEGPVFCAITRGGSIRTGTAIGARSAWVAITNLRDAAGVEHFTPHDLRHAAITNAARGHGVHVAQNLAGHTDVRTTGLYLHADDDELAAAGDSAFVPRIGNGS